MKKGSITIYMSLVLAVILSLFLTVIEGARCRAIEVDAESAFDLSVYSVFAEYNRQLWKEYDLFFIDTAYGEEKGSTDRVENHLWFYMEENLDKQMAGYPVSDFTKTYVGRVEVKSCAYATDGKGAVFERQAIAYMKQKYGISYVEKIKKNLAEAEKSELFTKDFSSQRNASQAEIDEAEANGMDTGQVDEEGNPIIQEVDVDNPADRVNAARSKGILHLLIKDTESISEQAANLSTCISHNKSKDRGAGIAGRDRISMAEHLLFDAYILEKCGTYTNPKKSGGLQYQAEYILAGKNNDVDNLKNVASRLLALREVSNSIHIFTDSAKVSEAALLAAVICEAAGAPMLVEPVKITLLFAWAYAEAIYDVKQLFAGNKVPLMKTAADWHYSLEGMLQAETDSVSKDDTILSPQNGLSYEEYLWLFLAVQLREQKVYHMMDIAEMDVRKNSGYQKFSIKNCMDYLEVEAVVESRYGYYREMKRTYYYI